jgi:hypothetical protein
MNTACLAPNGMSVYRGAGAPNRVLVGTAKGVAVLERPAGSDWSLFRRMTANLEAMSLYAEPGGFSLFAGATNGNVYCSDDGAQNWRQIAGDLAPVSKVGHYRLLLPGAVSSRRRAAHAQP